MQAAVLSVCVLNKYDEARYFISSLCKNDKTVIQLYRPTIEILKIN